MGHTVADRLTNGFQFERSESKKITVVSSVAGPVEANGSGAPEPIAATGVPAADRQVGWALALLVAGGLLIAAGRRRSTRRH